MRPHLLPWLLLAACTSPDDGGASDDDSARPADTAGDDDTDNADDTASGDPCASLPPGVHTDSDDAGFLFTDGAVTPTVFAFCVGLDDAALAGLAVDPETYTEATLTFGGETWTVGLRLKGSPSGSFRTLDEKASFKIKMHEYDPDQRLYGRKRLTLNCMIQDGSMLSEHASYFLFGAAGIPAPRHGYANVYVNGTLYGLYGVVETMDEEFLNRAFPDAPDGNLYEGGYGGDLYSGREDNFTVQETTGETEDTSDLTALIDAVEDASVNGDALGVLDAWFERDAVLTMWAVELVTGDADAYTTRANNFLLYHPTSDAPWVMIPWGPDQAFWRYGSATPVDVTGELDGRLAALCRAQPACSIALDDAIVDVLAVWEREDLRAYTATTAAGIADDCFADPRSSWGSYGCLTAQEETLAWIEARPEVVRAQVAGE